MKHLDEDVLADLLEAGVPDATIDLVLAALAGPDSLDAHADGTRAVQRPNPAVTRVAPEGTYLTGLRVRGFRGIGPEVRVTFPPGPGLTVIAGRNGSGKSSLAEAVECALTGTAARWNRRNGHQEFGSAWRNLHQPEPAEIEVRVDQAGIGPAAIRVIWPRGATEASAGLVAYQRPGQPQQDSAVALGWEAALQTYRPVLTYEELGQLLSSRKIDQHVAIASALALDELHDAIRLLHDRVRPLQAAASASSADRKRLKSHLETVDDERARQAAKLLSKTSPDTEKLNALVAGRGAGDHQQTLAAVLAVELPAAEAVEDAAKALASALADVDAAAVERTKQERLRDDLLLRALEWQQEAGDATCPVCDSGRLDDDWRQRVSDALGEADLVRHAARQAEQQRDDVARSARSLVQAAPAVLTQATVALSEQAELSRLWADWSNPGSNLVDHLRDRLPPLRQALTRWQVEAKALADDAAARWDPLAREIAAWIVSYEQAQDQYRQGEDLAKADRAAVDCEKRLRARRLTPIVSQAKAIWAELRQESSVALDDIELTGVGNRRGLEIRASVDDADGDALAVMSQGELNSLALALFIPRVTSEQSPFRFLILDDPVQAMDPTKVEGLASVLADIARTRQVIVFSHDDRLAQAVGRLAVTPTVLSVRRGPKSTVSVQLELGPARRYVADADALVRDESLDDSVRRRVVPGVLRLAVEEAAWQRYAHDQLQTGAALEDLEEHWRKAERTRARLELIHGDKLSAWLARDPGRRRILEAIKHAGPVGPSCRLDELVGDARRLVSALLPSAA